MTLHHQMFVFLSWLIICQFCGDEIWKHRMILVYPERNHPILISLGRMWIRIGASILKFSCQFWQREELNCCCLVCIMFSRGILFLESSHQRELNQVNWNVFAIGSDSSRIGVEMTFGFDSWFKSPFPWMWSLYAMILHEHRFINHDHFFAYMKYNFYWSFPSWPVVHCTSFSIIDSIGKNSSFSWLWLQQNRWRIARMYLNWRDYISAKSSVQCFTALEKVQRPQKLVEHDLMSGTDDQDVKIFRWFSWQYLIITLLNRREF
jgi:hypothetical protein